jgi:hypothetical protein
MRRCVFACALTLIAIVYLSTSRQAAAKQAVVGGDPPALLTAIANEATANSHAFQYLQELCDQIGGRLTGSRQDKLAQQWSVKKMRDP